MHTCRRAKAVLVAVRSDTPYRKIGQGHRSTRQRIPYPQAVMSSSITVYPIMPELCPTLTYRQTQHSVSDLPIAARQVKRYIAPTTIHPRSHRWLALFRMSTHEGAFTHPLPHAHSWRDRPATFWSAAAQGLTPHARTPDRRAQRGHIARRASSISLLLTPARAPWPARARTRSAAPARRRAPRRPRGCPAEKQAGPGHT